MHASDPVNRIMTEPVLTIAPSESLAEALRLFTSHPVHHLPVVEEERVVGMLSSADVAKLKFFLPPRWTARDALLKERWQVRKIMRSPALTVAEHDSTQRAAEIMAPRAFMPSPWSTAKEIAPAAGNAVRPGTNRGFPGGNQF
jgi:CBS domain-containing protein